VAIGSEPQGPFVDHSSAPLMCEEGQGGSIDPDPFTASDGRRYLYWKNDGNAIGVDTYISGQQLDRSGMKLTGRPKRLFKQDLPWEGNLVEAPFAWEHNGKVHMFYSANAYDSDAYAVGHAIADNPLGPFTKSGDPVLVSNDAAAGPGHCALFETDGRVWMVYHAWPPDSIGPEYPGRTMWLSEVTFIPDGSVQGRASDGELPDSTLSSRRWADRRQVNPSGSRPDRRARPAPPAPHATVPPADRAGRARVRRRVRSAAGPPGPLRW